MPDHGVVNTARDVSSAVGQASREIVLRFCFSFLTVLGLLWLAILMYLGFYYAYMPTVRHVKPVHLQFQSLCSPTKDDGERICSFPYAKVPLSRGERMLMRGQKYQVFLDLEMPNSPVNERLGMFMVKMTFLSQSGEGLRNSERSAMFHYKSNLLKTLTTMFYFLPMIMGLSEEKQVVELRLFDDYLENSYDPAADIAVTVFSRQIEIYSSSVRIEACFSGLRYIMFNWPVSSAAVAIACNFLVFCLVYFLAYGSFTSETLYPEHAVSHDVVSDGGTAAQEHRPPSPLPERRELWTLLTSSWRNGRLNESPRPGAHRSLANHAPATEKPRECRCPAECCSAGAAMLRSATFPPYRWAAPSGESAEPVSDPAALAVCRGHACDARVCRVERLPDRAPPVDGGSVRCARREHSPRQSRKLPAGTKRRRRYLKRHRVMYFSDPETEGSRVIPLYGSTRSLSDEGEAVQLMGHNAVRYCSRKAQRPTTSSNISSSPERQNYCFVKSGCNPVCGGNSKATFSVESRHIIGDHSHFSSDSRTVGVSSADSRQSFGDETRFSSGQRITGVLSANMTRHTVSEAHSSSGQNIRNTSADSRWFAGDEARVSSGRRSPFSTTVDAQSVSEGSYEVPDGTLLEGDKSPNARRVPDGAPASSARPSTTARTLAGGPANELAQVVEDSPVVRRRSANRARAKFGLALRSMLPSKKK